MAKEFTSALLPKAPEGVPVDDVIVLVENGYAYIYVGFQSYPVLQYFQHTGRNLPIATLEKGFCDAVWVSTKHGYIMLEKNGLKYVHWTTLLGIVDRASLNDIVKLTDDKFYAPSWYKAFAAWAEDCEKIVLAAITPKKEEPKPKQEQTKLFDEPVVVSPDFPMEDDQVVQVRVGFDYGEYRPVSRILSMLKTFGLPTYDMTCSQVSTGKGIIVYNQALHKEGLMIDNGGAGHMETEKGKQLGLIIRPNRDGDRYFINTNKQGLAILQATWEKYGLMCYNGKHFKMV